MANISTDTFQYSANLSLWFKVRAGDSLNLADIPEIISLRWTYFRDNWQFLKRNLLNNADSADDPDYFRQSLDDLTDFINKQRLNTTDVNPFSGNSIYFRFYPIFNSMLIEEIDLSNEEQTLIANKIVFVRMFSKNDFLAIKQNLTGFRDYLADTVGLTDPDYNRIYNRGSVRSDIEPTIADMSLMLVIQQQLDSVNFILANLFAVDTAIDPFALARLNASNPDINIGQYGSGFLVKLHSGESLESLATRYFQDSNKWIDIAIANGLKEPYIDEDGSELFLLANGSGNQINIAATDTFGNRNASKFHINQFVYIQSGTILFPSQRLITGIREIPVSGEIVLTLNGDANLGSYLLADNASLRIFKLNTINSSQFILIPSETPLSNSRQDEIPWFQTGNSSDEKKTKIDIALEDDGSLQLTPNGDIGLSYNLANAIQAIKLKFVTELGSNNRHQSYGMVNIIGTPNSNSDDAKNILVQSINTQIQADSRFDRIETISVQPTAGNLGPVAYNVDLVVRLAGSNTLIPISFTVAT